MIEKGKVFVIFGSPEAWIKNEGWRAMLGNSVYSKKLCALAIDEAHVIKQWYYHFSAEFSALHSACIKHLLVVEHSDTVESIC